MRMAMVELIGFIIVELASSIGVQDGDVTSATKQIVGLYDTLLERMLDLSSYVRSKVLHVLTRLCDLRHKFPKQRLLVTSAAVVSLEDKVTSVRRAAVALLVKLILTHPYGLVHGGLLAIDEFNKGYQAVKEELQKMEGTLGKAVEKQGEDEDESEEDEGEDDEEEEGDEEEGDDEDDGQEQKKKKKKKRY